MSNDKSINPRDLPQPRKESDTQQPEEFVDKSSVHKDENKTPDKGNEIRDDPESAGKQDSTSR